MNGGQPNGGRERHLCGARKRQGEGTCRKPAGWGTPTPGVPGTPCRLHGGNTRNHRKRAADAEAEDRARAMLAQLDIQPVDNPLTELQLLGGEVVAWKNAIRVLVNDLQSDIRYEGEHGEQLRAEVALFERAMDRCERVLTSLAKLNLDERLARIEEAKGKLIIAAVLGGLAAVDVPPELQQAARAAIAERLRTVSAEERQRERIPLEPPR